MTWDAWLNILIAVGVPGLMALCGGILAARALPREGDRVNPEVWIWSAGFLCLFLVSLILAVVQQVRITTAQQAQEQVAHQKELQDTGTMKFMAGQLDSISKALGSPAFASDPKAIVGILKSMTTTAHTPDLSLPAIQTWSNKKLRDEIISVANDMRQAASTYETQSSQMTNQRMAAMQAARAKDGGTGNPPGPIQQQVWKEANDAETVARNQFSLLVAQNYVGLVTQYHAELERRLGPEKPASPLEAMSEIWQPNRANWYGSRELYVSANVLEQMARKLP